VAAADRWGRLPLLADTSVWIWLPRAPADVQEDFFEALRAGQIRISPVVKLELLFGMSSASEFDAMDARLSVVPDLPLSRAIGEAALSAIRSLKERGSDGYHKVKPPDALIAATAAERGFNVLHYDRDYERLAEVLYFDAVRLAPAGSLA